MQLALDLFFARFLNTISLTAMAPVECVKLILQTQASHPSVVSGKVQPFTSAIQCFKRVASEQGIRSFWRGNLVSCLRYVPHQSSILVLNGLFSNSRPIHNSTTEYWNHVTTNLIRGGAAGTITSALCYPFDFVRTRLASDLAKGLSKGDRQFKGITDCLTSTLRQQGISGLYTGWSATASDSLCFDQEQVTFAI